MRFIFAFVFVLLVALCTFFSKGLYQNRIEEDLQTKVQATLEANDLGHMTASVKHHHLSLEGAVDANEMREAIEVSDDVWGAYMPAVPEAIPVVEDLPASLIVNESSDGDLIFEGVLPHKEMQARLLKAAAEIPGVKVVIDQTTLDPAVVEPEWEEGVTTLLGDLVPKVEGASLSPAVKNALLAAADEVPVGELELGDRLEVLGVDPSTVRMERRGQKFVVSGILPDERTHMSVVAQARGAAGQLPLEDRTVVKERISQSWWLGHARSFVPTFFKNTKGDALVEYSENSLTARGISESLDAKNSIDAVAGGLEEGKRSHLKVALKMVKGAPQPSLVARLQGEDLVLDGLVKSPEQSAAIEKSIQAAQPDRKIINRLKIQENLAEAIWRDSLGSSVSDLFSNADKPVVTAIGRLVKIEGEVTADEKKTTAGAAAMTALGDAIKVENHIEVVEAPSVKLSGELKELAVYFRTASFYVQKKEEVKVKKMAEAIKGVEEEFSLIVGGYADLRGDAEYNKQLSLQRANAVRTKLIALGVPAERMEVKFFGEDTSDVKKEDLWKSRRVELSIVEP